MSTSTANLLVMPDTPRELAYYWWEEANAHRTILGAMSPLYRFSVLPYMLDPFRENALWKMNHQQAQSDFVFALDLWTIPAAEPLMDTNFVDPEQRKWFTFTNHLEMYDATRELTPPLQPAW